MEHLPVLAGWESFYVIVGTSGAALTGLQFVVVALIAETEQRSTSNEVATFGTPTVVHFGISLLIASVLSAPWPALSGPAVTLGLAAAAGLVYATIVAMRARTTAQYTPVMEDWIWHVVLPFIAHLSLLIAGITLGRHPVPSLFVMGAVSVLFLYIGIHNAWDTVTFLALRNVAANQRAAAPATSGDGGGVEA